jgi:Holliday junction resolvase RusA-like endonuclease
MIQYKLPVPPSLNTAYYTDFKTRTRHKSKQAREWEKEAQVVLSSQKKYKVAGDEFLKVVYTFYTSWMTKGTKKEPSKIKKKDLANYEKVLTDFLVKNIEGMDDSQVWEITLKKHHSPLDEVHILITEL